MIRLAPRRPQVNQSPGPVPLSVPFLKPRRHAVKAGLTKRRRSPLAKLRPEAAGEGRTLSRPPPSPEKTRPRGQKSPICEPEVGDAAGWLRKASYLPRSVFLGQSLLRATPHISDDNCPRRTDFDSSEGPRGVVSRAVSRVAPRVVSRAVSWVAPRVASPVASRVATRFAVHRGPSPEPLSIPRRLFLLDVRRFRRSLPVRCRYANERVDIAPVQRGAVFASLSVFGRLS